ncbi:sulfite exporter TauE/SafE family protein [bacterium]|nr:sulfite exporter TauE/SafE family protein [bacterium]
MKYLQYFTEGWGLGFSLGVTCLATCGMIYLPYLISTKKHLISSFVVILKLSLGRFIGYLIFGAAAGYFGGYIPHDTRGIITDVIYVILGTFLIISAFRKEKDREKKCFTSRMHNFTNSAIVLGLLSGVNFCPPFMLALSRAFDIGGTISGMALFTGFFFGTIIYIIPLGFTGLASKVNILRTIARIASVLVGLWFIIYGISGFILYTQTPKTVEEIPENIEVVSFFEYERIYIISSPSPISEILSNVIKEYTEGITVSISPQKSNIVLEKSGVIINPDNKYGEKFQEALRKKLLGKKCLVILMPDLHHYLNEPQGKENIEKECKKVAQFLNTYYFKVDKNKGYLWQYSEDEYKKPDTLNQELE